MKRVNIGSVALFLLTLLCGGLEAAAQENLLKSEYSYRRYTTQDGLSSMRCNVVYQDMKGFIWIGTESGFSRYDGINFMNFYQDKNLHIVKFYEDEANNVVAVGYYNHYKVLPDDKVLVFTPRQGYIFSKEYYSAALPPAYGVYEDETNGHRTMFRVEHDTLVTVLESPVLDQMGKDDICYIYLDTQDSLWYIPTGADGLFIVDTKGQVREHHPGYFESVIRFNNTIYATDYMLSDGGLFKKTKDGLKRIYEHWFAGNASFSPVNDSVMIIKDSNYTYRYTATSNQLETVFSHVGYNLSIRSMIRDNEGNIWLATRTGLYNLFNMKFIQYEINYGAREKNIITGISEYPQNHFLLGTIRADLIMLLPNGKDKEIKISNPGWENGLKCFYITPFVSQNSVYAASCVALLKIKNDKAALLTDDRYFVNRVMPFGKDSILAISSDGCFVLDTLGNQLAYYSNKDLMQQGRFVNAFSFDNKKQKVFAGESGLTIIDAAGNIRLANDSILLASVGLTQDASGLLWVIAENRLCTWNGENAKLVYTFDNSPVRSVKALGQHLLLVSTTQGFTLFDLNTYHAGKPMKAYFYDQNNGFMGTEPLYYGIFEDSGGYVWLMCQNGTFRFLPEQLVSEQLPVRLHFSSSYSPDNIKWKNQEIQSKLTLSHRNNNVRFSFIGIRFSATQHVRYRYRLLGFQDEWSEPSKQREVTFNNLPPGNYVFEIYADAGTDESRSETQSASFAITPAFWQTAWFTVACIAFLMLSSAGFALYIQHRKNRALLEKLRAEKELNELRISSIRLKAIPHFNANVLSAIEYYIANRTKEEAMRILGIYSDFTFKTLSEVDKAARPLSEELAYVKMYLDLEKIRFMDKFDFEIRVEDKVDRSVQLPNMILHTYCENAVKHGLMPLKSGGLLVINVSQHNGTVRVSVEDNGVGRDYATKNPHLHSTKQGLSILNRQIEIYNRFNREKINRRIEDLTGETGQPTGTRFNVEVPLNFAYIN
jgi:ligand-binding sensor domain-containing protein